MMHIQGLLRTLIYNKDTYMPRILSRASIHKTKPTLPCINNIKSQRVFTFDTNYGSELIKHQYIINLGDQLWRQHQNLLTDLKTF